LSVWALYPPGQKIKLGLDLKGGAHLVLQVRTVEALRLETQTALERLRAALAEGNVVFAAASVTGPDTFAVDGVEDDAALRDAASGLDAIFERTGRNGSHTFRIRADAGERIRRDTVQQALDTIERRVNELGAAEPLVTRYGDDGRILVQLPGVTEVERAKQIIRSTAQLGLTLVEQGPFSSRDAALQAYGASPPPEIEVLPGPSAGGAAGPAYYAVRTAPIVAGRDLRSAQPSLDEFNRPAVAFTLQPDAARRFGAFTAQHLNRELATVLDGRVMSLATSISRIDDRGQIAGLTHEEMAEQVINLKSGALPAGMDYVAEHTVGASLGEASVRAGLLASTGGLVVVMLFMLAWYRLAGVNALVSIVLNLVILLGLVAVIPVTMTLPGIAGLILTIGMGVDSNVLIFERIREELARGRGARAAVNAGFDRVWITMAE
jgi:preprotein translocase subunit SecD